jgi:hypothetical protein
VAHIPVGHKPWMDMAGLETSSGATQTSSRADADATETRRGGGWTYRVRVLPLSRCELMQIWRGFGPTRPKLTGFRRKYCEFRGGRAPTQPKISLPPIVDWFTRHRQNCFRNSECKVLGSGFSVPLKKILVNWVWWDLEYKFC